MNVVFKKQDCLYIRYGDSKESFVIIKGFFYKTDKHKVAEKILSIKKDSLLDYISSLDGEFAIISKGKYCSFLAVDRIKSIPLYYYSADSLHCAGFDPKLILSSMKDKKSLNSKSLIELNMSGFVLGNDTVFEKLFTLKPGELVQFENARVYKSTYFNYFSKTISSLSYDRLKDELKVVLDSVFSKLAKNIGDKQVVIPLSAGNDSRLVLAYLKKHNIKNILCYSYGTRNNFEANVAEKIAAKAGCRWVFIELNNRKEREFYSSKEFKNYLDFSENYSSVPYIQGLSSIKYLKEKGYIQAGAVFINGNSGDFVSGSHINQIFELCKDDDDCFERKQNLLKCIVSKHYSLWGDLKTEENLYLIKEKILCLLKDNCGDFEENDIQLDHLKYEWCEFIGRQSGYVITGQRSFEFYGYESRMPLWDSMIMEFFIRVPAKYKYQQKLYKDVLYEMNLYNLWQSDLPVNKKSISPAYIIPIRNISKLFFVLIGKKSWKIFDKCVFYYWMDVTHMMKTSSYIRVLLSMKRKPRNHVSWHVDDYIKRLDNECPSRK